MPIADALTIQRPIVGTDLNRDKSGFTKASFVAGSTTS